MDTTSTGTGEIDQGRIEERANEIARAAGRDQFDKDDLTSAREEILGSSSPQSAGLPTDQDEPAPPAA